MTSSMITGEQRWASKRRSGMTVLGKVAKVAVPKPLNLPSQRLENHGLDPNVEIVPKGTLSWGSRPSSANSNAWGTSALSPTTDGVSSSPSHLAGRPLSSGDSRPSTAGSENAHDSNVNARDPNSRPSSASGVLGSNLTSLTSLRPRSAEIRPGSSQLSRFAEPSLEGSRAWGGTASSERTGVKEGFSLSSGDFPSLGSEKDASQKNLDPLDSSHERPGSSSGGIRSMPESMEIAHDDARDSDIKGHSWRNTCPLIFDDGPRPSMDRWHGDPHFYQNPNSIPPHYDSWRGPPSVNPPSNFWYRGPPGPPPYGGPIPPRPGGFHMDPFPYYRPQAPPVLDNSQLIPPPRAGHHGHHSKNGDMYRPHMPEPFLGPGMPMRPGFYPSPVPYEGPYRPPMGFCNPNERDFPFVGMAAGPPIYNRPANQNAPDLNSSHLRSFDGRGPDKIDPRGNNKVLVKADDGWNQNDEEKRGHWANTDGSNREKGILSNVALQENGWGDDRRGHDYGESATKDEVPSRPRGTTPVADDLGSSRDHSLIHKIEGLNVKARDPGVSQSALSREKVSERVQTPSVWAHQSIDNSDTKVVLERHYPTGVLVPVSRDTIIVASDKSGESTMTTGSRRVVHGAQNSGNHRGKGNLDGKATSGVHKSNIEMTGDGESAFSGFDHNDTQRAKMREIAKQRAIQLRKEEEERIKEQKAKAHAKLEELNRRSAVQGVEVPSQKEILPPHATGPPKTDDSRDQPDLEGKSNSESSSVLTNEISHINENGATQVHDVKHKREDYKPRQNIPPEKSLSQDTSVGQRDVLKDHKGGFVNQETAVSSKVDGGATQVLDISKHRRAGYKPRQNIPLEKKLPEEAAVASKVDEGTGKELPETPLVSDSPAPHKKRNNKSGKNKHKVEDSSIAVSSNNSELGQQVLPSLDDNASKEPSQVSGDHSSLPREDAHGKGNNSRNAQHSRKPRSSQGNRVSEKAQSNDSIVWAPVRSQNKVEITDRTSQKAAEPLVSSEVGENMPKNNSKIKRAEIERYVPKPAAKELAQGSIQQPPSLSLDHPPGAQVAKDSSQGSAYAAKVGPVVEGKNGHARGRGPWHQRVSEETNVEHNESTMTKLPNTPTELSMKGLEAIVCDGWNILNEPSPKSSTPFTGVKDKLPSGRVKKHAFKGQKGNSQNFDQKDSIAGLADSHCATEINHTEKTLPSRENRAVVDRSVPHWQPKSKVYVAHNPQGSSSYGGQNHMDEDIIQGPKLDIASGSSRAHSQSQYRQYVVKDPKLVPDDKAMQDIEDRESKLEKRGQHVKGYPASQELEDEVEQRPSSGYRKNSNYGGRVNHESRGGWSNTAPESKHYYSSSNSERQRQSSHYEYQPVGPSNSNNYGSQSENQHGGPQFRGRGPSRRGRGNFHGRQGGNE